MYLFFRLLLLSRFTRIQSRLAFKLICLFRTVFLLLLLRAAVGRMHSIPHGIIDTHGLRCVVVVGGGGGGVHSGSEALVPFVATIIMPEFYIRFVLYATFQ